MEPVCPLDYRYGRERMREVLSYRARVARCLEVEAALARAHARVGNIPKEAADEISRRANLDEVSIERVEEIEKSTRHDLMSIVNALTERCSGDAGKYVHLGATSYDIVDTALALQFRGALDIVEEDIISIMRTLARRALENRDLIMVGRTHGQFAVPITLGLKLAVYIAEFGRHLERIRGCRSRVEVGKMSGAVGSGAALGPLAFEIEGLVMDDLGLGREEGPTQIVQRDRMFEMFCHIANITITVEKIATEIRTLQRPEIGELSEPFDEGKQVGSSTMSHKRNPILCENITGLARTTRGFLLPAMQNGVQWNERDLSNSSSERFIIPHMFMLLDECLSKLNWVLSGMVVDRDRIGENLGRAGGLVMAESVMMALVAKGMGRQEAHEVTRKAAMLAYKGTGYYDALISMPEVDSLLNERELRASLDPSNYVGISRERVDRILESHRHIIGGS